MKLGKEISTIRKEYGMTQEAFGQLFHVTRQTVSNWENEKSYPDLQTLVEMSNHFGTSLDTLLKEDEHMIQAIDKERHVGKRLIKGILAAICIIAIVCAAYYGYWYYQRTSFEQQFQNALQSYGFSQKIITDENGNNVLKDDGVTPMTNREMLEQWSDEHPYVDIGIGFEVDGQGNVIPSTAFDSAISGIGIMGYGVDADGDPKNLASIMLRLADIFEGYDHETQTWNVGSRSEAEELLKKLDASREAMGEKWTTLDTEANFLDKNGTQLENTYDALNVERSNLEDIDPADAILELVWAQTCYNAALQVGTNAVSYTHLTLPTTSRV